MKASTSSELYPGYFRLLLLFCLPRALLFWVSVFLPTGVFYITLLPYIFVTTCFYQELHGSRQFFLEVCSASCWSSKHRPGPSVCLIHSNPQSSNSEEFVFKLYQILSWITCGKKFSLSATHLFQTLFACSKSYVKTTKITLNKTCNCFDETTHQSYFEKAAKRNIKQSMVIGQEMFLRLKYLFNLK